MKIGLYVGSFDPITLGHLDVVHQALAVFDHVQLAIGLNPKKVSSTHFDPERRRQLIISSLGDEGFDAKRVGVSIYSGSMMNEARERGATGIIRGLRQISDFGEEFTINGMVARVIPDIPMVYFICRQDFLHVSSSSVKEMARLGEDYSWMVSKSVQAAVGDV